MLTTGEWCGHSQQHAAPCVKGVEWGLGTRFENSGSVLGRHPGLFNLDSRGYKGDRHSSML